MSKTATLPVDDAFNRAYPVPTVEQVLEAIPKVLTTYREVEFTANRLSDDIAFLLYPDRKRKIHYNQWRKTYAGLLIHRIVTFYLTKSARCTSRHQSRAIKKWKYDPTQSEKIPPFQLMKDSPLYKALYHPTSIGLDIANHLEPCEIVSIAMTPWQKKWIMENYANRSLFFRQFLDVWLDFWEQVPTVESDQLQQSENQHKFTHTITLYQSQIDRMNKLVDRKIFASRSMILELFTCTVYQEEQFKQH